MTLCESCKHKRDIISGKGSRFLLCELALTDDRYPKYPPQPMLRCGGYVAREDDGPEDANQGDTAI